MQRIASFLLLFFCITSSHAVLIGYDLSHFGGNRYRYTVENNGSLPASANIELFDIEFDTGLYSEASLTPLVPRPLNNG